MRKIRGSRRRVLKGRGFMDFLKKGWNTAKKYGVFSKAAELAGNYAPGVLGQLAGAVAAPLAEAGYGRRRRRGVMGKGYRLAGAARRRRIMNY